MFRIKVSDNFSAAHHIEGYPGDCSNLHGHNWKVVIAIRAEKLDELGMACDFREAKTILKEILNKLDHTNLDNHPWFTNCNPTSERIAQVIFERLSERLPENLKLEAVEIFESDSTSVEYRELSA